MTDVDVASNSLGGILFASRVQITVLPSKGKVMNILSACSSDTMYSAEELLGMILEQAREYAQDFAGKAWRLCVSLCSCPQTSSHLHMAPLFPFIDTG